MVELTRRSFLGRAALGTGAGVLAGGVVGTATGLLATGRGVLPAGSTGAAAPSEALVAHVRNVSTGEIALMFGTREVVYQDRALAAKLMDAARRSAAR